MDLPSLQRGQRAHARDAMRVTTEVPLQNHGTSRVKVIFLSVTGKCYSTGLESC